MSSGSDITTQAIRLALRMSQMQAENASQNISRASTPGAHATAVDFGRSQGLLQAAAEPGDRSALFNALAQSAAGAPGVVQERPTATISLDEEVANMSSATLKYQALTESLNRHFGLMRLAITGRN